MAAYASFENDTVKVMEAKTVAQVYSQTRLALLFYVSVGSSGISSVLTKPTIKLVTVLNNGSSVRRLEVSPTPISNGLFSDVTPKTFILYPTGVNEERIYTLDTHTIYPVEHIQGHVYFEIPITPGERLLTTLIVANA